MDISELNDWIEASKRKDGEAFRKIVESYQSMIYSVSFRLLCDEEEAKDAVQETFVRVWLNLPQFHPEKKFSTWIYAIATHLCLDKLKASKKHLRVGSLDETLNILMSGDNTEQNLINKELAHLIATLTDTLTPKQKIVFTLRDLEALEVEEVTQITGMSAPKIKSNLFLARQAIRLKLSRL